MMPLNQLHASAAAAVSAVPRSIRSAWLAAVTAARRLMSSQPFQQRAESSSDRSESTDQAD